MGEGEPLLSARPLLQPPFPRWFGALKWRKLSLGQLEAPTLRLIKEVRSEGLGGRGGVGGASSDPVPIRDPPTSTSSVTRWT